MLAPPPLVGALVADVAAGGVAAIGCAPLVACVDQAITLSASGQQELWPTLGAKIAEIFKAPVKFFTSAAFIWLWFVYCLTYAVANSAATISRALGLAPAIPVLVCSTAANMGARLDGRGQTTDRARGKNPRPLTARRSMSRAAASPRTPRLRAC